jgi:hypothetical protein
LGLEDLGLDRDFGFGSGAGSAVRLKSRFFL